ncbi:MAG: hypothetical protein U1F43_14450 [Myxococcota bacterium]
MAPAPPDAPAFVAPFGNAPLDQRARTYLHANCAQCHRAGRDPDLRYPRDLEATGLCNNGRLVPGNPDASRLVTIMRENDATIRMPKSTGNVIDDAGVALIASWVASLSSCP